MLSNRIERLKSDVTQRVCYYQLGHHSSHGSWVKDANPWTRDVALDRIRNDELSVVQLRGFLLREVVELSAIDIYPDWTLAGEHLCGQVFHNRVYESLLNPERLGEFGLEPDDVARLKDNLQWFNSRARRTKVGQPAFDVAPETTNSDGKCVHNSLGWMENHSIRDYRKLIQVGYAGLSQEIMDLLNSTPIDDPDFPQKENFWKAALAVCQGGIRLGEKYAELAAAKGLVQMAATCRQVPARGARTFHEAVQALWFGHILTCGEDGINANSLGRIDQILYPYYQADIKAGTITRQDAVELLAELACKLYLDYDVQAITLGGTDAAGNDATNELTYIMLEVTEQIGFIRDVSVRITPDTPARLYEISARMLAKGGGIPFLFNDTCFIKALTDRGIKPEHAWDYAPIGCIELTIPGKANPHAVSGWFHATKCLELAMHDGVDPVTGEQLGPQTGKLAEFESYDAFYAAYKTQVEHFARHMVYSINRGELLQQQFGPLPCWSVLTDDCVKRGRDITDGGPLYNYHSICLLGTANTADSLYALKKLVFEEKAVAAEDLLAALANNFEDAEPLRQMLLNQAEKYGNDCDAVDRIAAAVDNHFIDLMDRARSPLDGRYFVHLFSFLLNLSFGAGLGATPDGRKRGEPLAYSLSAQQGRDQEGITAMLNSLAKLPHHRAAGASAAIVDIDPKMVEGQNGIKRFAQLLRSAMDMGVGQLQMNVVSEERLKLAKVDPEKYGNIPVRVAGYSQLFRLLDDGLQDHVIARTKHQE
jgi:formate C-acetyltransferase